MICTPAERDLIVAGATRLVAPGDTVPMSPPCKRHEMAFMVGHCTCPMFVAPRRWVDATGPCPTCDGSGIEAINTPTGGTHNRDCPDCIDGRKREALQVACPECDGKGTPDLDANDYLAAGISWADGADDRPGLEDCYDCSGEGLVTFAYATVEVLPVVECRNRVIEEHCIEAVTASYTREWHECTPDATHDRWMHRQVVLDRVLVPGRDWVVLLDNVELT